MVSAAATSMRKHASSDLHAPSAPSRRYGRVLIRESRCTGRRPVVAIASSGACHHPRAVGAGRLAGRGVAVVPGSDPLGRSPDRGGSSMTCLPIDPLTQTRRVLPAQFRDRPRHQSRPTCAIPMTDLPSGRAHRAGRGPGPRSPLKPFRHICRKGATLPNDLDRPGGRHAPNLHGRPVRYRRHTRSKLRNAIGPVIALSVGTPFAMIISWWSKTRRR